VRDGVDQMSRGIGWKKTAERWEHPYHWSVGQWEITGMMRCEVRCRWVDSLL